jgi:hypothetical protein
MVHFLSRSERVVPRASIFGGFPCTTLLPSTPGRILKREIAGATRADLRMWPEPLEAEDVSFLVGGKPYGEDDVGLGRLMAWAHSGEYGAVHICVGNERVPLQATGPYIA